MKIIATGYAGPYSHKLSTPSRPGIGKGVRRVVNSVEVRFDHLCFRTEPEKGAMTMDSAMRPASLPLLPSRTALFWLFAGGFLGLMAWEVWARFITASVLGGPLEPSELVISLARTWLGIELPRLPAEAIHYAIGIIGYPIAYYVISRTLKNWAVILDIGVWLAFTVYAAILLTSGGLTGGIAVFWLVVTAVTATRFVNPNRLVANCLSWGSFTWFNALGLDGRDWPGCLSSCWNGAAACPL
jgi:hypothetical protein